MSNFDEKVVDRIKRLEREVERLRVKEKQVFVPLTAPLTSTAWDGDAFSTTAKTKIDLSEVFGVPAGVKAIIAKVTIRDSGSATSPGPAIILSPNDTSYCGKTVQVGGRPNDYFERGDVIVPCNSDGDIYYQIDASGTGTLDAWLEIWGYWL